MPIVPNPGWLTGAACLVGSLSLAVPASRAASGVAADSVARADSARIARVLEPLEIHASRLETSSGEVRQRLDARALRTLPVDRPADALALLPGVVVEGGRVHLRGARPGELRTELDGIGMNEPLRGETVELPLLALDGLELIGGGLEADRGGGLAGVLVPRPHPAGDRWRARLLWQTAAPGESPDDRAGARVSGPLAGTGAGIAAAVEARLDDASLPDLRTPQRTHVLGASLGWRARNQVSAMVRVSPVREPGRVAIQALVSRRLLRPFNPMFSQVGWTSPCPDPNCLQGPAYSPVDPGGGRFTPYNAADHVPVTDIQRRAVIVSTERGEAHQRWSGAIGWNQERRLTSVDGRDDEQALDPARRVQFGLAESATSDPFHAWTGDVPYYRKSRAEWLEARLDWRKEWTGGGALGAGLGGTREWVQVRQLDFADVPAPLDSIRIFTAAAPGAYAWISGRWAPEGMIATGGLRGEWWTPGPDAAPIVPGDAPHGVFSLSPRLGLTFPLSPWDDLIASYARIVQPPGREYLYDSRTARITARHPLGNPMLQPSTAISYEITWRHRFPGRGSARVGFFNRDLFRQISARTIQLYPPDGPPGGESALRYESDDAGHAAGIELDLESEADGPLRVLAGYTWMHAEGSESFEDGIPIYPLRLPQPPPIEERPLAWDQNHRVTLAGLWLGRGWSASWSTFFATGLPWTPAETRTAPADESLVNSRRLPPSTVTDVSLRENRLGRWLPAQVGLEIRNLFDFRGQQRVSIDGYPNRVINTAFDDYAAHREATGLGGGAYWNDVDGDGIPGWVRVRDPRLDVPPRSIRLTLERSW